MRTIIPCLVFMFFVNLVVASETSSDSNIVDNLFVRVESVSGSTNLTLDKRIVFFILTKTNESTMVFFPKPEYLCEIELRHTNGLIAKKTELGDQYGQKFSELTKYSFGYVNRRGRNTGGDEKPDMTLPHNNRAEGRELPSLQELFQVNKNEPYKLSLRFQIFKQVGSGTNYSFRIVRFPATTHVIRFSGNRP